MRTIRIWWLKRKARSVYMDILQLRGRSDAGENMTDIISGGELKRLQSKLSRISSRLKEIDPEHPGNR